MRVRLTSPRATKSRQRIGKGLTDLHPLGLTMIAAGSPAQALAGTFLSRSLPAAPGWSIAPFLFRRLGRSRASRGALAWD